MNSLNLSQENEWVEQLHKSLAWGLSKTCAAVRIQVKQRRRLSMHIIAVSCMEFIRPVIDDVD
ncbi:hypothetical protein P9875_19040 [Janthinobacterium rivuli]|uniref:PH domain-containing protein n=1 Tax=Janthinobacterium rivuli TaxID=2751478 RepID=A0ABY8HZZ2_9BURK|nr:hypothetical protein [Janthinobacterium rivuli]WFR77814.1 hypothetical protein P9875_19040 [Janthinobacterium rivuli]